MKSKRKVGRPAKKVKAAPKKSARGSAGKLRANLIKDIASLKPKKLKMENDRIEVFKNDSPVARMKGIVLHKNQYNWHRVEGKKTPNVLYSAKAYDSMQGAKKQARKHAKILKLPVYQVEADGSFKLV